MNSFSVVLLISDAVAFCLNRIFSLHYPLFVTSTDDDNVVKIQRDFGKNSFEVIFYYCSTDYCFVSSSLS